MKNRLLFAVLLLITSLLAACSSAAEPAPTQAQGATAPASTAPAPAATLPAATLPAATATPVQPTQTPSAAALPEGYRDVVINIDGAEAQLTDGVSEVEAAPGSESKIVTRIAGDAAAGDLNGDGIDDAAFFLTQEGGGSGTFYYAAAALKNGAGFDAVQALFLGDRVEPQSIAIQDGAVVVTYLERKPDQAFTEKPTVRVTKTLRSKDGKLEETSQLSQSQLTGRAWRWLTTERPDGTLDSPIKRAAFTITFAEDGTVSGTTDCNSFGGKYVLEGDAITFSEMMSTQMFCDGSQEGDFMKYLGEVKRYEVTGTQLILIFADETGKMTFE